MEITPFDAHVLVTDMEQGDQKTSSGIIISRKDNGKSKGIRPRWAKIHSFGKNVKGLEVGQWVLIEHGRWSREISARGDDGELTKIFAVDYPSGLLMVSDDKPDDVEIHSTH